MPLPPYIKELGGRRPAKEEGAPRGGVLLLVGVGLPFPTPTRRRKGRRRGRRKEREEKEERGAGPLVQFGLGQGGRAPCLLSSATWPMRPITSSSYSCNSPVPSKIPESLRTFPMSENSRPIYRSLRLSHFETPRHVPDLIRNSELPSLHQNT